MTAREPYTYNATVLRVIDGDTVVLRTSLGFGLYVDKQTFRLAGCNANELAAPGGKEARDHLAVLLPAGAAVVVDSVKNDKYSRFDARVFLGGVDLVAALITDGWLAAWDGKGAAPKPVWPRV